MLENFGDNKLNIILSDSSPAIWFAPPENEMISHFYYSRRNASDFVRRIDGRFAKKKDGLFKEFYSSCQLTEYFGFNWHALEECLCYLDEVWPDSSAYILVIKNADLLLVDEVGELEWFFKVIVDVKNWWGKPISDNAPYNRPAKPFRCVLETSAEWKCFNAQKLKQWNLDFDDISLLSG